MTGVATVSPIRRPTAAPAPAPSTARPPRLPTLTGMRFFAALAVVLCHVGAQFTRTPSLSVAAGYGYLGVSFFFLLSGFVLTWSCRGGTAVSFLWARFCRIWPLQVLLAVVAFTVLAAQEQLPGPVGHLAELLLLQAWSPRPDVYFGGNGVSWSLSCEMFFYLLFPLWVRSLARLRGRGLAVTAGSVLTVLLVAPLVAGRAGMSASLYYWLFFIFPPYRFGEFLLGMVLARAVALGLRLPRPGWAAAGALVGLGVVVWQVSSYTVRTGVWVDRPLMALLAVPLFGVLLLAGATGDLRGGRTPLSWALPVRLGEWSFALYLIHKPLFLLTHRWGWWTNPGGLTDAVTLVGFLLLAVAVAATLHHALEKPVEHHLRRWPARITAHRASS